MSAILIEGDAEGWYESGPVKNVRIENNTFIGCAYNGGPSNAVIALNPSNSYINANLPVHQNVHIIGNKFKHKVILYICQKYWRSYILKIMK